MANVTYNGQSFAIDQRRVWLMGAGIEYARVPKELWADRIAAAQQAGFNLVQTACPWLVHEPRRDRFTFEDQADLRGFIELCSKAGMYVALKAGPYVGGGYCGGGLPAWLGEIPDLRLREANGPFLQRATGFLRRFASEINGLQVTQGGPVFLIQTEHAYLCHNDQQAAGYLNELTRTLRECSIDVPITNANDLWQDSQDSIHTWRGWDDLLSHLRQLRTLRPEAPRIVSTLDAADPGLWDETIDAHAPQEVLQRAVQVLAAGAHPMICPFHGGTNFSVSGGRLAGRPDAFSTTAAAVGAALGEAGHRSETYGLLKRIAMFTRYFGHILAEFDSEYQPVVPDVAQSDKSSARRTASANAITVVPQRGSQGQVIFVFGPEKSTSITLLLEDGLRLPIQLGDQQAGWYVLDVDLQGVARLDYANLCPFALVDRSILVLQGPKRSEAVVSINGTPLEATVPGGSKPLVLDHLGITVVICNQQQIDATYCDDNSVYVGAAGLDDDGEPIPHPKFPTVTVINTKGTMTRSGREKTHDVTHAKSMAASRSSRPIRLTQWLAGATDAYVNGESPRFASLAGPETLSACGAQNGYGWYRITFKTAKAHTGKYLWPMAGDRLQVFLDSEPCHLIGVGRGATNEPFDMRLGKGSHTLVVLADELGRFSEGNDLATPTGLFGHLYEIKRLRSCKPVRMTADPVDPFVLRGLLLGHQRGHLTESEQLAWTFSHFRKTPILVDITGASPSGVFLLNDEPIAYYAGVSGAKQTRLLLTRETNESFKRGKNVLRFAPDEPPAAALTEISAAVTLYECIDSPTSSGLWSFAKWEPPPLPDRGFCQPTKTDTRVLRGRPCWWRTTFGPCTHTLPAWFDTIGLSKGRAFLNGRSIGRYFTAFSGRSVGPQTRLYLPDPWLNFNDDNELQIFDEQGCHPVKTRISFHLTGDLD